MKQAQTPSDAQQKQKNAIAFFIAGIAIFSTPILVGIIYMVSGSLYAVINSYNITINIPTSPSDFSAVEWVSIAAMGLGAIFMVISVFMIIYYKVKKQYTGKI